MHIRDDFESGAPITQVPASWFNRVARFCNSIVGGPGVVINKRDDGGPSIITVESSGTVRSVDGVSPDANGNVQIDAATQDWVEAKGYLTEAALAGYATQTWADARFAPIAHTHATADITGLATYVAVAAQTVFDASITGYATQTWVSSQLESYALAADLTSLEADVAAIQADYVTSSDLAEYATKSWVQDQNYVTEDELGEYLTTDDISQTSINALAAGVNVTAANVKLITDVVWNGSTLSLKYRTASFSSGVVTSISGETSATIDTPTVITWS